MPALLYIVLMSRYCLLTSAGLWITHLKHQPTAPLWARAKGSDTLSSSDSSWIFAANIKKFGFLLHFRYPDHVKTWPVLTAHLASNYTPLPLLPQQPWIKDGQTLMSAMLLDSAHDVPTEFKHSCLWPEYTVVEDAPSFPITSCNIQRLARLLSCHIHFTFKPTGSSSKTGKLLTSRLVEFSDLQGRVSTCESCRGTSGWSECNQREKIMAVSWFIALSLTLA